MDKIEGDFVLLDVPGWDSLKKSRPVPWQDFEHVPLFLCAGTKKNPCPVVSFVLGQFKAYVSQEILNWHSLRHSHSAEL